MHKSLIIMRSEFMRRVSSKTFIITTLLAPLLIAAVIGIFGFIVIVSVDTVESDSRTIGIVDDTGVLLERILERDSGDHELVRVDAGSARSDVMSGRYDGYVRLPAGLLDGSERPEFFTSGGGFSIEAYLGRRIERALEDYLLDERNVPDDVREIMNRRVSVESVKLTGEGEEAGSTFAYGAVGGFMGILMYMTMLIYGSLVMYAAIEDKSSRVVEIIVSSARPFDLLMGKVLGIGAMGLVQIATWALMILAVLLAAGALVGVFVDPAAYELPPAASSQELLAAADIQIPSISPAVFVWFILYFVGGFILYAGLFAAVGVLVESPQEAQPFLLPVMMPLVLTIAFIMPVTNSPDSTLALVLSLIPLTSPVPMVIRMAVSDVPFWQVLLSYSLLVGGFLGSIWLSARIFRTGMLMYGKKASLKDLVRWFRYS